MGINNLTSQLGDIIEKATGVIQDQPLAAGAIGAGTIVAGATTLAVIRRRRKTIKRRSPLKRNGKSKLRKRNRRVKSKSKKVGRHKHKTSRKGKQTRHTHRGTKQIHLTKKGQPYILLASGKARFISRRSAKLRRKLKGGFY